MYLHQESVVSGSQQGFVTNYISWPGGFRSAFCHIDSQTVQRPVWLLQEVCCCLFRRCGFQFSLMLVDVADRRLVNVLRTCTRAHFAHPGEIGAIQQFYGFALSFIEMTGHWDRPPKIAQPGLVLRTVQRQNRTVNIGQTSEVVETRVLMETGLIPVL